MKRSLFYMLFLLLFNTTIITPVQNNQKNSSFYNYYFTIKELSKFYINYGYYLDQKKIEKSKIACNQCDYIVGYRQLCCYYIFEVEEVKLKNIMDQMKNASAHELSSLLLNSYEQPCIACDQCKEYHGWHTETSDQIIQNEKEIAQVELTKQKLYQHLFLLKELCAIPFYACFYSLFLDQEKVEKSKISCLQCNYKFNVFNLWGWIIGESDSSTLQDLKNIIYYGSVDELSSFVLKNVEERKIACPYCGDYNGYYIAEQQPSTDN